MNKILYVARKARRLTEVQMAHLLQMDKTSYQELECSINEVSAILAKKLSAIFEIPGEYFMLDENRTSQVLKTAMDEVSAILRASSFDQMPPSSYFSIVSLGNKALSLQVELNQAHYKQLELERDNESIKALYLKLKEELEKKDQVTASLPQS